MKGITLLLASCALLAVNASAATSYRTENLAIVKEHIVPRYQQLADASKHFEEVAAQLCGAATQENLDATRQAFNKVMDGWQSIQHIRNGPVEQDNRYYRFQFWPDKHNTTAKQLANFLTAKDSAILEHENFKRATIAVQGLEALERLLFSPTTSAEAYAEQSQASYRCKLVQAIGHNVTTMAQALADEWRATPAPWHLLLSKKGELKAADVLAEKHQVYTVFYNNLYIAVQAVIDQKLVRPLADNKPIYFESSLSQRSARNIRLNLAATEALYDAGFAGQVREAQGGAELDKQVKQAYQQVYQALDAIKQPLDIILKENKERALLETLLASTSQLQRLLTKVLPEVLGIPIGFNILDGD